MKQTKPKIFVLWDTIGLSEINLRAFPFMASVSVMFVLLYLNTIDVTLTDFYERAIGPASVNGVNASVREHIFWRAVIIFAVSFAMINCLVVRLDNHLTAKLGKDYLTTEKKVLFELGLLLAIGVLLYAMRTFSGTGIINGMAWDTASLKLLLLLIFAVAVVLTHSAVSVYESLILKDKVSKPVFEHRDLRTAVCVLTPLPLTYFLMLIASKGNSTVNIYSFGSACCFFVLFLAYRIFLYGIVEPLPAVRALLPMSFIPMSFVVGNEIQYTLTKYGMMISPKHISLGVSLILLIAGFAFFLLGLRSEQTPDGCERAKRRIKNFVLPVLLVTLSVFTYHLMTIEPNFDLLHYGNKTMPAQQLYQFGQLPIIDIIGHQPWPLGTFLYMLVNGNNQLEPTVWFNFVYAIIVTLISYFVIRQFAGTRWTALLLCFSPIVMYTNSYYIIGLLPLTMIKRMREKRDFPGYALFLLFSLIAFVYQASSGKIAVLASAVVLCFSIGSKKEFMNLVKAGLLVFGVPVAVGVSVLLIKGIGVFDWLTLLMSANTAQLLVGAYANFVSDSNSAFEVVLAYGLLPLSCIILLIYALMQKNKSHRQYCFVFLCSAAIICALRMFARHSLAEGLQTGMYPLVLVIAPIVFASAKWKKIATAIVIAVLIFVPYVPAYSSESHMAVNGIKDFTFKQFEIGDVRCDTINNPAYPKNLRYVMDSVLEDEQTFFEGINAHLLYSLLERKCVLNISATQFLQYEKPQIAFSNILENLYNQNKVPIVIYGPSGWFGSAIDGIPSELGLFKLSEFIYAHYTPWIEADGFLLWKANNSGIDDDSLQDDNEVKIADVPTEPNVSRPLNDVMLVSENPLKLICGESDPFIGFALESAVSAGEDTYVKMIYKTSASGNMQVFYDYNGFNETDSSHADVVSTGDFETAYFPVSPNNETLKALRIDPLANTEFEIRSVELVSRKYTYNGHNYLQQNWDMKKLPYIWGKYDEKISKTPLILQKQLEINEKGEAYLGTDGETDKSGGNYICLNITAAEDGQLTVSYGYDLPNSCRFDIMAGTHDYLVRVSSQYSWFAETTDRLMLTGAEEARINSIALMKGD